MSADRVTVLRQGKVTASGVHTQNKPPSPNWQADGWACGDF